MIYHTHPGGSVNPSREDLKATADFYKICKGLGIELVEHIIFNELTQFSFRASSILEEIANCVEVGTEFPFERLINKSKEYLRK